MKATKFFWSWNDYAPQPDNMTRDRAARLLKAWRSQIRKPANYKNVFKLDYLARGIYRVHSTHGEVGTMFIEVQK